jgi:alkanesulfonate monooxygenase SsuD/methylene tetrahydromethanopterin reductase-like flavin-dependent oxidoreductase (luciferase family)
VFAPLTLASTVGGLDLMTNVAIASPRNPIQLAHQAIDHQILAKGRFTLGLGTQIRTQIEKRYGAAFDKPVARMVELVGALRAIFDTWTTGERLNFRGEFYRLLAQGDDGRGSRRPRRRGPVTRPTSPSSPSSSCRSDPRRTVPGY